ncbi:MAG: hypothetical protein AAF564_21035 [Bacteroidota bacterium]
MTKFANFTLIINTLLFLSMTCDEASRLPASQGPAPFDFVLHDTLTVGDVAHLTTALEANYARVAQALAVDTLPTITVQIWSDEQAYQDAMEETLGARFPGSRGYVTGDRELRLLYHRRLSAQKEAVHEFAHVVSLNLNPDFGNNPRWLWEAVALYLADEFNDPANVAYMRDKAFPTMEELNAGFNASKNIYDVGYLLVDYIISEWGQSVLIDLINTNGDIPAILGVPVADFESGWHQFVTEKYLSSR